MSDVSRQIWNNPSPLLKMTWFHIVTHGHPTSNKIFANDSLTLKLRSVTYWYRYQIWEGSKSILLCGPRFLIRKQRRIWGLTHGKNKFIKERTERAPQGRDGLVQERHCCWNDEVRRVFKKGLLHIHLRGHRLAVLIDSCKLHNSIQYCSHLSIIQYVLLKCMYV